MAERFLDYITDDFHIALMSAFWSITPIGSKGLCKTTDSIYSIYTNYICYQNKT